MPGCAIPMCKTYSVNRNRKKTAEQVIYHYLPRDPFFKNIWLSLCRKNANGDHARVCSKHFTEDSYERDLQAELLGVVRRKRLRPDAVPTLNLFTPTAQPQPSADTVQPVEQNDVEVVSDSSTDSTGIAPSVETEPVILSTEYNKDGKSLLEWLEMVSPKINVPRVQEKGVQTNLNVADPEKLTIETFKRQKQRLQRKVTSRDKIIADLRSEIEHLRATGYSHQKKCVKRRRARKKIT